MRSRVVKPPPLPRPVKGAAAAPHKPLSVMPGTFATRVLSTGTTTGWVVTAKEIENNAD